MLFHCQYFRKMVLQFRPANRVKDYLINDLQDLFRAMLEKKKGVHNSKRFMHKMRKLNVLFDNDDHHDSHEFLSWLLNEIHENIVAD